jgi:hypothetical protein
MATDAIILTFIAVLLESGCTEKILDARVLMSLSSVSGAGRRFV